jgi:5-dehydro-4-deoxyglucarate dehydratase
MHHLELKRRLRGVMAFPMTPFTDDDALDLEGLSQHVDFLCRRQVPIVVVCGGVGEFFSLELDEYRAVIRTAVEAAQGRALVLAGIGHSTRIACQLAAYAERVGADGLMVNPPYFVQPSDEGLRVHYAGLAQATSLGLIVFSTPGAAYTVSKLERLIDLETVVGFKDEVGDLRIFGAMVERYGDRFAWINGMAELLAGPYAAAGAQAMTSGIVNVDPDASLAVWDAATTADWARLAHLLAERVRPLAALRERRGGYQVAVVKEAMNLLGRPGGGRVRAPVVPLADADREDLRRVLQQVGLMPAVAVR